MLGGIGMPELIIVMVIVMILFGGRKLPEIGSGLGKAIQGFRKATNEPLESLKEVAEEVDENIPRISDLKNPMI
jgi:sec-independent protein translocase protein TatA